MKLVILLGLAMFFASMTGCASHRQSDGAHAATWNGHRIAYDNIGSGDDAIIFVHGWASSRTFWKEQMSGLSDGRTRLIAIDLLGHGDSDAPEITYTMDVFADSIAAVMDDAGVDEAVLVGHSMGTPVVRQFYRRYPNRTEALVVVDGGLKSLGTPDQYERMSAPLRVPTYRDHMNRFIDSMSTNMDPTWREHIRAKALETPQHVIIGGFDALTDEAIWRDDTINVPVLAILADSPMWTSEYRAYVESIAPKIEWRQWNGVTHFLFIDRPDDFNREVRAFVDRVDDND